VVPATRPPVGHFVGGLGLHLVWRLVTLVGGIVDGAGEESRGTTFTVTLPRAEVLPLDDTSDKAA